MPKRASPHGRSHLEIADELHERAAELAVAANEKSRAKHGAKPNDIVRDALFVITHDAIIMHRAIQTVVVAGWSSAAMPQLRTLLDLNISLLAVLRGANPRLNAFRYFYTSYRRLARDPAYDGIRRREIREEMRGRIKLLSPKDKDAAFRFLKERDRRYWYSEEWSGPAEILRQHAPAGADIVYQQLSSGAHGGFLGLRLFRDEPDEFSINPRQPRAKSVLLLMMSTSFIIDMTALRSAHEKIEFEARCVRLRGKLQALAAWLNRSSSQ